MRRIFLLVILLTSTLFAGPALPTVNSVTDLRALLPGAYSAVQLLGYTSPGDGGGGVVNWIGASTKSAAACSVYVPTVTPSRGRWERPASPFRLARQCGVMTMADTISGIVTYTDLVGSGTRMVVVSATGTTSTQSIPSGGSLANPTGTIGLSAVNGVLTSAMRSDGAPALSQAIVPTWTGVHTFTPAPIFSSVTASQVLLVDGSKALTSSATTGTGSFMRAGSPAATGTLTGVNSTWSGDVGVTGFLTFSSLTGSGTRMVVADGTGILSTQAIPAAFSLANPTGVIGLSAVNGSSTSGIRADGAPALSQAIVPTWTGKHTFSDTIVGSLGIRASDAYLFRGSANMWKTPDSLTVSGNIFVAPGSGGSAEKGILIYGDGSPGGANTEYFSITHSGTEVFLDSRKLGTGTAEPITFGIGGVGYFYLNSGGINTAKALVLNAPSRPQNSALTSGTTIAVDASVADFFTLTLATNAMLLNPTNGAEGSHFTIRIRQDVTGGRTLGYDSDYRFPGGVIPVLSTAPNAIDYLSFVFDEVDSKYDFIGNAFDLLPGT